MLRSALLGDMPHGFTGRVDGDFSPVPMGVATAGADARLVAALGGRGPLRTARQVHGKRVVDAATVGDRVEADAILSTVPGRVVAVRVADCVPLLIAGPGVVAAVHAGWRGTAADIVRVAVAAVCDAAGCTPQSLRAALGPCIRGCCYEVGDEVIAGVGAVAPGRAWVSGGRVDLAVANAAILGELRVPCEIVGSCTHCSPDGWSHRRDGASAGRQVGAIGLPFG